MARFRNRIIAGVKFAVLEKVSVQVISLFSFFVVLSNLSLSGFGTFNLLFSIVGISTTITSLGIARLVVADISVYRARGLFGDIKKLFVEYSFVALTISFLLSLFGWLLIDLTANYFSADLISFYWVLVFLIIVQTALNLEQSILEGHEKFFNLFVLRLVDPLVRLAAMVTLVLWLDLSLLLVLWAYVISKFVAILFGLPVLFSLLRGYSKNEVSSTAGLWQVMSRHGKWEAGKSLIAILSEKAPIWIVNTFLSTEAVAIYAFVKKIHSVLAKMLPVRSAIFPILVNSIETSHSLASIIITKAKKYLFIVYVILYVSVFISAEFVIETFLPQYSGAEIFLYVTLLRLFVGVLSLGQTAAFYALKKQKFVFHISLISIPLMLIAQLAGTYYFGLMGMIWSILLTALVGVLTKEYVLYKKFNFHVTKWDKLFVFDQYDRIFLNQIFKRLRKILPVK